MRPRNGCRGSNPHSIRTQPIFCLAVAWIANNAALHFGCPEWFQAASPDADLQRVIFETEDGVLDFHCLRVSYVTNLVKSGANPKIVQTRARHSTIVLTMDLYAKQDAKHAAAALKMLPPIPRRRRRA